MKDSLVDIVIPYKSLLLFISVLKETQNSILFLNRVIFLSNQVMGIYVIIHERIGDPRKTAHKPSMFKKKSILSY